MKEKEIEKEANQFALAILMPKKMLFNEMRKYDFDLSDPSDDALNKIASKFQVSLNALVIRIAGFNQKDINNIL